jgi:hypothetical protein
MIVIAVVVKVIDVVVTVVENLVIDEFKVLVVATFYLYKLS